MKVFPKDPNSIMDYDVDWSSWLNTGATIATSIWIVPAGIVKDSDTIDPGNKITKIVLSGGGTLGTVYEIVNRITTSNALTEDRILVIKIGENVGGEWRY